MLHVEETCAVVCIPHLPSAVFSLHLTIFILWQSPAGPRGVQTAGATAERASPRTTRCCLSRASKAAPAQSAKGQRLPPQRLPPQNPPRRWTSWAWTGWTSAVPQLRLRPPRPPPPPPPPQISWGTCLGGHHSQPVGRPLPSPHHTKWLPTQPRRAPRLHQVGKPGGSQAQTQLIMGSLECLNCA